MIFLRGPYIKEYGYNCLRCGGPKAVQVFDGSYRLIIQPYELGSYLNYEIECVWCTQCGIMYHPDTIR